MITFYNIEQFNAYDTHSELTKGCFVIKGYCSSWEMFRKNILIYLSEHYSNDEIVIEEGINSKERFKISVKEYISRLLQGANKMGNWSWQPHLSHSEDFQNSFTLPESVTLDLVANSLLGELVLTPWLLMSAPDTMTSMHQDAMSVNGVVGQLQGIKEFVLVAPDYPLQEGKFYTQDELEGMHVPYQYVIVHPGDFLYFPMGWWHQAKTIECSVTFIHSTVNQHNLTHFLNAIISHMPNTIQRVQLSAKKLKYFGNKINWLCNGFRLIG